MSIQRRLRKLESRLPPGPLDGREQEEQRRRIREDAQRSIERGFGRRVVLGLRRDGHPRRPDPRRGDRRVLHAERGTAFSRNRCYLPRFFWAIGVERADPWCMRAPERIEVGP